MPRPLRSSRVCSLTHPHPECVISAFNSYRIRRRTSLLGGFSWCSEVSAYSCSAPLRSPFSICPLNVGLLFTSVLCLSSSIHLSHGPKGPHGNSPGLVIKGVLRPFLMPVTFLSGPVPGFTGKHHTAFHTKAATNIFLPVVLCFQIKSFLAKGRGPPNLGKTSPPIRVNGSKRYK